MFRSGFNCCRKCTFINNYNTSNQDIEWPYISEYAYKSNLLKFSHSEIRDWLKLYDNNIDIDSIHIRDVNCCGQKYITYLTNEYENENDSNVLYQYVIVRGTKNWKNIKTSLQYTIEYNNEFEMYLHNGYGSASHAILRDLKQFINPMAKLRMTGHSYGGVVCCCIALNLHNTSTSQINEIVTFGMPQFTTKKQMKYICQQIPIIQVQHIKDQIAQFDWNKYLQYDGDIDNNNDNDYDGGIIFVGNLDDYITISSLKTKKHFVHRMGDYVKSIEKHIHHNQK